MMSHFSLGVGRRVSRFSDRFKLLLIKGYVGTVEPTLGGGPAGPRPAAAPVELAPASAPAPPTPPASRARGEPVVAASLAESSVRAAAAQELLPSPFHSIYPPPPFPPSSLHHPSASGPAFSPHTPHTLSSPLCPVSCGRANGISLFLPSRPPLKDFESVICLFSFLFYLYLYPHLRVKTVQ